MATGSVLRWRVGPRSDAGACDGSPPAVELSASIDIRQNRYQELASGRRGPGTRAPRRSTRTRPCRCGPTGRRSGWSRRRGAFPGQEAGDRLPGAAPGEQQEPQPGHPDRRAAVGSVHHRRRRHRLSDRRRRLRRRDLPQSVRAVPRRLAAGAQRHRGAQPGAGAARLGRGRVSRTARPTCRSSTTRRWSRGAGTRRRATPRTTGVSSWWTTSARPTARPRRGASTRLATAPATSTSRRCSRSGSRSSASPEAGGAGGVFEIHDRDAGRVAGTLHCTAVVTPCATGAASGGERGVAAAQLRAGDRADHRLQPSGCRTVAGGVDLALPRRDAERGQAAPHQPPAGRRRRCQLYPAPGPALRRQPHRGGVPLSGRGFSGGGLHRAGGVQRRGRVVGVCRLGGAAAPRRGARGQRAPAGGPGVGPLRGGAPAPRVGRVRPPAAARQRRAPHPRRRRLFCEDALPVRRRPPHRPRVPPRLLRLPVGGVEPSSTPFRPPIPRTPCVPTTSCVCAPCSATTG